MSFSAYDVHNAELGIGPGIGGLRREDADAASNDMIEMLPTSTFTAANKIIGTPSICPPTALPPGNKTCHDA